MWAAALLLATANVLSGALADEPNYKEGVRLYEQVDLEGAIAKFNAALATPGTSDVEKASLHAWIALSHAQLGRKDDATASFRAAVKLDRNVKLPALAPPDVEKQLEAARAELPPSSSSTSTSTSSTTTSTTSSTTEATPVDPSTPGAQAPQAAQAAQEGPPLIAVVTGGAGIALLLAGGATFAVGVDTAFRQAFEAEFNDDARALVDLGYLEYAVGGALAGAGLVGLGAAVVFALE